MILHSDSTIGALMALAVILGSGITLVAATYLLATGDSRGGAKAALLGLGAIGVYVLAVVVVSVVTPQTIVDASNSYCVDIWCIGIDRVSAETRGSETLYKVDVNIFSDANRVKTSAKGASLYLLDERGRHFPLIDDPSVIPFDSVLSPGQSIKTTLTFATAPDARQLYLTGEPGMPPPFWVKLYFGSDTSLFHKPTLLRVL